MLSELNHNFAYIGNRSNSYFNDHTLKYAVTTLLRTRSCCRNLAYSFQLCYPDDTDTYIYFVCYGCNIWFKTFLSQGNNASYITI